MLKGRTKSQGQKHSSDKFYTQPHIAELCLSLVDRIQEFTIKIEPSAGSGTFSSLVPDALAFDLEPEGENIVQQDWFLYEKERDDNEHILVFGNPPFGQQNSLAIKFINHAAKFANEIAFILPLSFKKTSVINRLDKNLHLANELILPKNSFTLEGVPYDVPCVFQVWKYNKNEEREISPEVTPKGFKFVKKTEQPTLSIQRVGGRAGFASLDFEYKSVSSNYFIILDDVSLKNTFIEEINRTDFIEKNYSVGPRSLSKSDIAKYANPIIESFNR